MPENSFPRFLGNAWDEAHEQDKAVMTGLAGSAYGALSGVMARWYRCE